MTHCVGLFGTCGNSTWRDSVIEALKENGVVFFNPQVDNWTPELAVVEATHLSTDSVLVVAITDETTAFASLAEVGFAVAAAAKAPNSRAIIVHVAREVDPNVADAAVVKDSNRARKLVLEHLKKCNLNNVFVVDNLNDLTTAAIAQYNRINNSALHRMQFLTY